MKTMKETVIGQMENGKEILGDIRSAKKSGRDFIIDKHNTKKTIDSLHPKKLDLKVVEILEPTKDAKTFRLVSKNGYLPPFEAGQYINIFAHIDGVRTSRPYSISSSPRQRGYYEITVDKIAKGFVSDYFREEVQVGDEFEANGPDGTFHFNPVFHHKKSIFLAGGCGITPFMSMIREILETGEDREVHLIYGCRNEDVSIFHEKLTEMSMLHNNFHYTLVVSDEGTGFKGREGFIDAKCIKEVVGDLEDATFYLCGPEIMIGFCLNALDELNIKKKDIRREMFASRQDIENEPGWPEKLTGDEVFQVKVGDKVVDAKSNESLLISMERAGIRVNVCCRSGECSLCRVKLIKGDVFMPSGVLLRHADEKFGYIHSCKAYPMEDLEISF